MGGNLCRSQQQHELFMTDSELNDLVSTTHFTRNDVIKIQRKFAAKSSKSGTLTRSQFVALYNSFLTYYKINPLSEHISRVFALRNNNNINFDAFVHCLSITACGSLDEKIDWMFHLYDIDGDRVIEMHEICHIMRQASKNQTSVDLLKVFKGMDSNKDGVISYEEFTVESRKCETFMRLAGLNVEHEEFRQKNMNMS